MASRAGGAATDSKAHTTHTQPQPAHCTSTLQFRLLRACGGIPTFDATSPPTTPETLGPLSACRGASSTAWCVPLPPTPARVTPAEVEERFVRRRTGARQVVPRPRPGDRESCATTARAATARASAGWKCTTWRCAARFLVAASGRACGEVKSSCPVHRTPPLSLAPRPCRNPHPGARYPGSDTRLHMNSAGRLTPGTRRWSAGHAPYSQCRQGRRRCARQGGAGPRHGRQHQGPCACPCVDAGVKGHTRAWEDKPQPSLLPPTPFGPARRTCGPPLRVPGCPHPTVLTRRRLGPGCRWVRRAATRP